MSGGLRELRNAKGERVGYLLGSFVLANPDKLAEATEVANAMGAVR